MRSAANYEDDEDTQTRIYFEPPHAPEPLFELAPQLEPDPIRSFEPTMPVGRTRFATRRGSGPRPAIGILVAATCVLVGVALGGAIAASGSHRGAASAAATVNAPPPVVAPVVMTPVVTPIEAAPAPAAAPAPSLPPPQKTFP